MKMARRDAAYHASQQRLAIIVNSRNDWEHTLRFTPLPNPDLGDGAKKPETRRETDVELLHVR
jgi:hypothetical protein